MQEQQIQEIVNSAVSNIKNIAETNTVIGSPLVTVSGATILPISQVNFAFVAGGGEYGKKPNLQKGNQFAGGSGGGGSVTPIGFLVVDKDDIKVIKADNADGLAKLLSLAGDALSKIIKS